jgi:hypothetical protein
MIPHGTFDSAGNYSQILVRAPLDGVVTALAAHYPDITWRTMSVAPGSEDAAAFAVLQFAGMDWSTVIWAEDNQIISVRGLGKALSKALSVPAIELTVSDTAGVCGYEYFQDGKIRERYQQFDGETEFKSKDRDGEDLELEDYDSMISEFLLSQEAFALPVDFAALSSSDSTAEYITALRILCPEQ